MSPWPPDGGVGSDRSPRPPPLAPVPHPGSVPPGRPALRAGTRATALATLLLLTLVMLVSVAPLPAHGVTQDPPGTARIVLNGLEAVLGPVQQDPVPEGEVGPLVPTTFRARVLIQNLTDQPLEGLRLVVDVRERAVTRSQLRAALDTTSTSSLGRLEHLALDEQLDTVPAHGFVQTEVTIDGEEAGLVDPDDDVTIHPVVVSVIQGRVILDEVRTATVGVARPVARPLETTLLAPLDGPAPSSDRPQEAAPMLLPGGRLDRLLRAVEAAPPGAVTVAPAPHAVEDLVRLVDAAVPGASDMLTRLQAAVVDRAGGVVSMPYALADVPALASSSGTEDLASAAIVAGRQRLLSLVGRAPDAAHLLLSPQTPDALDLAPADVLVALWDDTSGPDLEANPSANVPPALRTTRSRSGRSLGVLVGDPWVTSQLAEADGRHGWDVDAHRTVIESAMTFAQSPGQAGRAFAVVPPVGWDAPGRLADELYSRLARAPWLRTGAPATVAARAGITAPWTPAESVTPDRTPLLRQVASLDQRLSGLAAAVTDVEERPAVVRRGDDLLRAMSVWPDPDPLERARMILDDLATAIDEAIGEVDVPRDSVVTLASESGVIPVTVQHPEGVPMDVVVEVAAQGRLTFNEGTSRPIRLEEGGTATVSFPATALSRGTFPLSVTVSTPNGDLVLDQTLLSVRASAVSRPALIAIAGVVLLLLVVGRLRRPKQPRLEVVE